MRQLNLGLANESERGKTRGKGTAGEDAKATEAENPAVSPAIWQQPFSRSSMAEAACLSPMTLVGFLYTLANCPQKAATGTPSNRFL